MSQQYTIGKVAPTPRGAYVATTTYNPLDIVTHNGSSYWVLQSCTGITPPNETYYQLIASKGNAGTNGSAATVDAGSITMLAYGSSPTVTNAGTANAAVFNFGIPYSPVADGSVGTTKIADASVTRSKIAGGAVGNDELSDGSVSYSKLGTDAKALLSNIEDIVAETFSPTSSYNAGDYVIYGTNNVNISLYRFTADKSAGAWDSSKVTEVTVCSEISDKVSSESVRDAGIFGETYTTIFDTATVTTSMHDKTYPWVKLSSTTDLLGYNNTFRVTFDNTQYTIPCERWFSSVNIGKSISFVGNATLWGDINGFIGNQHSDYPFLITSGMDTNNTHTEGLYLFTETVGSHSVKVERVQYEYTMLPPELVCGYNHLPIYVLKGQSHYTATSIGVNIMQHLRDTLAFGTNNTLSAQLAKAFGHVNTVSGDAGTAIGRGNNVSGSCGQAIGENNTVSGYYAVAIGRQNTSSENSSTAFGYYNTASGGYATAGGAGSTASGGVSTAIGYGVVANHLCQTAIGMYNEADTSAANAGNRGNYIEIVGNGTGANARSNARTLDWDGNESLAGGLTLGKGTANEVSITAQQLQQLLALLN